MPTGRQMKVASQAVPAARSRVRRGPGGVASVSQATSSAPGAGRMGKARPQPWGKAGTAAAAAAAAWVANRAKNAVDDAPVSAEARAACWAARTRASAAAADADAAAAASCLGASGSPGGAPFTVGRGRPPRSADAARFSASSSRT